MASNGHPVTQHSAEIEDSSNIAFSWLLLLRWGAVACQGLLIFVVSLFFDIKVPVLIVSLIIAFQGVSNLFFSYLKRQRPVPDWLFALVMFMDVILLTALLFYTGGPMNPFTFLYLIHIVLGSILMRPKWAWGLTVATIMCYASFFFPEGGLIAESLSNATSFDDPGLNSLICHDPTPGVAGGDYLTLHLQGMWVAFSITAFFIVFFVGRIQKALEEHHQTLVNLEEEKIRSEKLASLAALAAGAAHEFSTPLSTIAVASGEMLHFLKRNGRHKELIEDTTLIREQVERCKEILYQMAADAGEHLGETVDEYTVQKLLDDVMALLSLEDFGRITVNNMVGILSIMIPPRTLRRTLRGLIKNGLDASGDGSPVAITFRKDDRYLYLEVEDKGEGMDQETLSRGCEPFFTRKELGKGGLGLGLFLAKSVAQRFGGDLHLESEMGKGSRVILSLSLEQIGGSELSAYPDKPEE